MFFRMLRGAFGRQRKKLIMIAITVMLGASLATAMLNVMMDVGDKVNQELKTYGANITVVPKSASVVGNLYEVEDGGEVSNGAYLLESELGNIKTIFWAFNIVDFAPFIDTTASLDGKDDVKVVGTWFNHHMELPTGEILDAGVTSMRSWWDIVEGSWLDEKDSEDLDSEAMVGEELAKVENIHAGDKITVSTDYGKKDLTVKGIFNSGDDADNQIYTSVNTVQALSNTEGYITSIEVSALTTPDNELAEKAAKDPGSLTISQYETWYCTAYASSICYQIQEVITDSVASPVRQ
ncbi:MAG: ABC transporter permease, partial [Firmicutes bacterium]|nr:ABC transporter permease [Bacillota bacterium]